MSKREVLQRWIDDYGREYIRERVDGRVVTYMTGFLFERRSRLDADARFIRNGEFYER